MRKAFIVLLVVIIALPLLAGGRAERAETLRAYSIWPESFAAPMFEEFTRTTGIEVQFVRHSSGEVLARLIAEKENPQVDMVFGGPADTFAAMVTEGVLEAYTPPGLEQIPAEYRDTDGYWFGMATNPLVFLTNQRFLEENGLDPPTSWFDLLRPEYANSIQTADARTSGTAVSRIMSLILGLGGEDEAFDYMRRFSQNVQIYTKSGGGGTIPVATGEANAGVFFIVDSIATKQRGYDVVISFPKEGVVSAVEASGMVKGARNPHLAQAMLDWLVTPEAQSLYARRGIGFLPTHPAAEVSELVDVSGAKLYMVDMEWAGQNRRRLVERWVEEIVIGAGAHTED